ncbi:MAG: hypothetical protein WBF42_06225 [Terracidiphilus sp.]
MDDARGEADVQGGGFLMSTRVIVGIASLCAATTGLIVANMFLYMMIGEINPKRAEGNLVSYFGFAFPKMQRIFSEYSVKYPSGRLHIYALLAFAAAMVGLLGVVSALGFFG